MMFFFLIWYSRTRPGHKKFSRFTLSLPLFGSIILHAFMALFCRTTAALLSAGVSVLDSFEILGGMAKNDVIKDGMFVTKENVVKGSSISASMSTAGIFPNLVLKMVKVGEQAGTLPEVLERTADYYERKVEALISTMTKMLEPILIIIVGAIVLVTVIALYLPIFSMSDI
jgi:type IV pilus assembly protein PilC